MTESVQEYLKRMSDETPHTTEEILKHAVELGVEFGQKMELTADDIIHIEEEIAALDAIKPTDDTMRILIAESVSALQNLLEKHNTTEQV